MDRSQLGGMDELWKAVDSYCRYIPSWWLEDLSQALFPWFLQVHFTFLSINNIKCQVGTPLFFLLYHLVKSFPSYPESQGVSCSFAMLSGFIQGRLHKVQLLSYTSVFVHSQIYLQYLQQSHSMHEYAPYPYAQVHAHPAWLSSIYCTCCTYVYSKYLVSSK